VDQSIILNRLGEDSIEVLKPALRFLLKPGQVENFNINIENRGDPVRVGFKATGDISDLVLFLVDNVLVDRDTTVPVKVRMVGDEPRLLTGRVEISTRYATSGEGFLLEFEVSGAGELGYHTDVVSSDQPVPIDGTYPAKGDSGDVESHVEEDRAVPVFVEKTEGRSTVFNFKGFERGWLFTWVPVAVLALLMFVTFYLGALPPLWGGVACSIVIVYIAMALIVKMFGFKTGGTQSPERVQHETDVDTKSKFGKL